MINQAPAQAFLEEASQLWPYENGFYHVQLDGAAVGAVCLDDLFEEDEVGLSLVKVRRGHEGHGFGSRILDAVCALANKHYVALYIDIVPTGRLNEEDLIKWYERRGFEAIEKTRAHEGNPMCRAPQPAPVSEPGI